MLNIEQKVMDQHGKTAFEYALEAGNAWCAGIVKFTLSILE